MDPATTDFLVVRHGQTVWNMNGRIQGHLDSPLTPTGRAQAAALAARFAGESIAAVYASDLGRTRETAAPIAAVTGLAPLFDAGLRERCYGTFEALTWREIEVRFPQEYARFASRDPHYAVSRGESAIAFRDRVRGAFHGIAAAHPGRRVAVVTHGGVLGVLYRIAAGMPLEAPRDYTLANASLNRFTWRHGTLALTAWGDVSHLEHAREDGADGRDTA